MLTTITNAVSDFNYIFGVINEKFDITQRVNRDMFDNTVEGFNENNFQLRYKLIKEEINELHEAYANNDCIEIIDALCDILYVVYGAVVYFNFTNPLLFNTKIVFNDKPLLIHDVEDNVRNNNNTIETYINSMMNSITNIIIISNKERTIDYIESYEAELIHIVNDVLNISLLMDINLPKMFDIVHNSNMSKFCDNLDDAEKSVQIYNTTDSKYTNTAYREMVIDNCVFYIIFDTLSGKILKSYKYTKAKFL